MVVEEAVVVAAVVEMGVEMTGVDWVGQAAWMGVALMMVRTQQSP